jgi:hypothetical protein
MAKSKKKVRRASPKKRNAMAGSTRPPKHPSVPDPNLRKRSGKKKAADRFSTDDSVKWLVRIRAAGHCEQCGVDLTQDFRVGRTTFWSEVAHIQPASPKGPRADGAYSAGTAKKLTNDPDNLLLLCPGCHERIDKDEDGYPILDLVPHHLQHIAQIRHAASVGETSRAMGLIFLSQHFQTRNIIRKRDLADAMFAEKLWAVDNPIVYTLRAPGSKGRDKSYWKLVEEDIEERLDSKLNRLSSQHGDPLTLAVVGLADIPALIRLGGKLGDRSNRVLFSSDRTTGLRWSDPKAPAPEFIYRAPSGGIGPVALVISLSAKISRADVIEALPDAQIAEFSTPEPSYGLIKNRHCINAFRDALQIRLSTLEATTSTPIHVFAAIPAAMAIEFGALLSTQHAHEYVFYDRNTGNKFERV